MTAGTGLLNRKETLLHANLTLATAGLTSLGLGPWLGARAITGGASLPAGHLDLGCKAIGRLLQGDLHSVAQVAAAIDVAAATTTTAATGPAKNIAKDVAKGVSKSAKVLAARTAEATGIGIDTRMTKAIVCSPFLGV